MDPGQTSSAEIEILADGASVDVIVSFRHKCFIPVKK